MTWKPELKAAEGRRCLVNSKGEVITAPQRRDGFHLGSQRKADDEGSGGSDISDGDGSPILRNTRRSWDTRLDSRI